MQAVLTTPMNAALAEETPAEREDPLALIEQGILKAVAEGGGVVREMCAHITGSGGKRIRPQLVVHCGLVFSCFNARVLHTAVAAELIHMASLVHDDVIDKANLRRGKPSVNKLWGNHAAVLCGDWLFAAAFGILSGKGLSGSMRCMVEAIQAMCAGELLQAGNRGNLDISENTYFSLVGQKTAKLLESCCKAGAMAGGCSDVEAEALGEYGRNIGMAFQIIDDVLDFTGKSGRMGKPKGEDLRQGIVTLPVILLLRDKTFGERARELSAGGANAKAAPAIRALLTESSALAEASAIAGAYIDKAERCLTGLPDSPAMAFLQQIASGLRHRDK